MTPEKEVQNKIYSYLKDLANQGYPVYVERRQAGGFSYKMGIPDLYAVINGLHVEIEIKAPGKQLRPMQEKFRDMCKVKNIIWTCADSLIEFKSFLSKRFNFV